MGMSHAQFAEMKFENGETMMINTQYITSYAYIKSEDKTVVSVLCEAKEVYFPGDQTQEIKVSFDCISLKSR